jgi:hypothetical protein
VAALLRLPLALSPAPRPNNAPTSATARARASQSHADKGTFTSAPLPATDRQIGPLTSALTWRSRSRWPRRYGPRSTHSSLACCWPAVHTPTDTRNAPKDSPARIFVTIGTAVCRLRELMPMAIPALSASRAPIPPTARAAPSRSHADNGISTTVPLFPTARHVVPVRSPAPSCPLPLKPSNRSFSRPPSMHCRAAHWPPSHQTTRARLKATAARAPKARVDLSIQPKINTR